MRIFDDNLRKRKVIAADGHAVGEVVDSLIDTDTWHVESLQIKLRKEAADQIGANRGMFHAGMIDVPVRVVQSVGDAVVLTVPLSEIREVLLQAGKAAGH